MRVEERQQVDALLRASFPTKAEAVLVKRLRASGDAAEEHVALNAGRVTAYLMLSRMRAPRGALGLGPVAAIGGRGHGMALIKSSLRWAEHSGWNAVFVLGAPEYYERFGFARNAAARYRSAYPSAYMSAVIFGAPPPGGTLIYAPAFDEV